MTSLPISGGTARWDFAYDSEWYIPLPSPALLEREPLARDRWVTAAVDHYAQRSAITDGDREALAFTADGLLGLVGNAAVQLWFVPRGVYSDVLIEVTVSSVDDLDVDAILREIATLPDSTASELAAFETDTHGNGFLLRRTSAVQVDDEARPIANWTVMLRTGEWAIMIEAMGSTLEPFALMEEQIPKIIAGITLPSGVPA
ncbi:hypothetical protein SRABI76_02373 [Microbacterium oxydans]|uniref:Uncharacterized protein n=1 Tax=Microbacterium oxydans TaxID=82380 RepID=A0A0F0LB22_9MICO|nr:hypothetical protein [Microbacterium oxydans]KJL29505.1 hypothetical protein RS83_01522 [Microbacterium oxydans]CAH0215417.1 hypothetical protein SRABI76_02373 [Microbacterium oxydans]